MLLIYFFKNNWYPVLKFCYLLYCYLETFPKTFSQKLYTTRDYNSNRKLKKPFVKAFLHMTEETITYDYLLIRTLISWVLVSVSHYNDHLPLLKYVHSSKYNVIWK